MSEAPSDDALNMVLQAFEEEMEADLRARYGETGFRVWRDAPARPRLDFPSAVGRVTGECGDSIAIALRIAGDVIVETDFDTDGCASSLISAATAAVLAKGQTLDEAVNISDADILARFETYPEDEKHCAYLAAAAVREAIHVWMIQGGSVEADLRARFGDAGFERWRAARGRQRLENPSVIGKVKGHCGDTIAISLRIEGETITDADFDTDGCPSSFISAATAADLARGQNLDDAVNIDDHAILAHYDRYPEDEKHCAYLAAAALREAIHAWMIGAVQPD